MTPRTCSECGTKFEAIRTTAEYCSQKCRATFNNRRQKRGVVLYDLFMAHRSERERSKDQGFWSAMCRLAANWKTEDEAADRKSYTDPGTFITANPHLSSKYVGQENTGRF